MPLTISNNSAVASASYYLEKNQKNLQRRLQLMVLRVKLQRKVQKLLQKMERQLKKMRKAKTPRLIRNLKKRKPLKKNLLKRNN